MDHRGRQLASAALAALTIASCGGCSQNRVPDLPGQIGQPGSPPRTINGIRVNGDGSAAGAGPDTAMAKIPANFRPSH